MANTEFVAGLSGKEIVEDVIGQVRRSLMRDCNLRESDCYGRGYSGKITIHLDLFDIDVAKTDAEIVLSPTKELLASTPETPQDIDGKDVKVDVELEVPMTNDLNAVRERSNQTEPQEPELTTEGDTTVPKRRSYGKPTTIGGAVDVTD